MEHRSERRKSQRITTYLPVRLRLQGSGRYLETLAKDVSMGGIRCMVEGRPTVNDPVVMEVPLYKEVLPIQTQAHVAWVQSVATSRQSMVGVSFDELSPVDRLALAEYLERLSGARAKSTAP